jgi:hypothetical protein
MQIAYNVVDSNEYSEQRVGARPGSNSRMRAKILIKERDLIDEGPNIKDLNTEAHFYIEKLTARWEGTVLRVSNRWWHHHKQGCTPGRVQLGI